MGLWFSSIFSSLFGRREIRVLILGLDNAGKTTILCAWRGRLARGGDRRSFGAPPAWPATAGAAAAPPATSVWWCACMMRRPAQ